MNSLESPSQKTPVSSFNIIFRILVVIFLFVLAYFLFSQFFFTIEVTSEVSGISK